MVGTIPTIITGIAVTQLLHSGTLDTLTTGFFQLPIPSQISLFAVLFSIVFLAVGISQFLDDHDDHDHSHDPPPLLVRYPLNELQNVGSGGGDDGDCLEVMYPHLRTELGRCLESDHGVRLDWVEKLVDGAVGRGSAPGSGSGVSDVSITGKSLTRRSSIDCGRLVLGVHRALIRCYNSGTNEDNDCGRELTPVEVARSSVLGWTVEFLHVFLYHSGSKGDGSPEPTNNDVCTWLESAVYVVLQRHFGQDEEDKECYEQLVRLFHRVVLRTKLGRLLDQTNNNTTEMSLTSFTMDRYRRIVRNETAFGTFYLPVALGMIMGGVTDPDAFDLAEILCGEMGEYFQIRNDYKDCFGDADDDGKVGTDIQQNKCTWLVIQALERATSTQRTIIEQNYGQWDDSKVQNIKTVYRELDMTTVFTKYEEKFYTKIQEDLEELAASGNNNYNNKYRLPRDVFDVVLEMVHKKGSK